MFPPQPQNSQKYPDSPRQELVEVIHGVQVPDPYRWLEDIDAQQTQEWISAQNKLTLEYLEQIPAREKIRQRITELWDYEKVGTPFKRGGRYFFTRNDGLQNQNVLYWMTSLDAEPQALLDPNLLSEDGTIALTDLAISDDGKLLAYGLSSSGSDWQEWHVREVANGQDLDDHLKWVKFSVVSWTHDGAGFFYSRYDAPEEGMTHKSANYHQKLDYHRIGTPQSQDELVYERPDHKEWGFEGQVTEDGRYLIITVWNGTQHERAVFYKDLHPKDSDVVELLNEFDANYVFIANDGPLFYFMTDLDAPMSRVVAVDIAQPERAKWKEVIPESSDALQFVRPAHDKFIAVYLHDAHSLVKVLDKDGDVVREIELPSIGTVAEINSQQADGEAFFLFTGFTTPSTVFRYDVETGQQAVFYKPAINFDPDAFETKQIFSQSKDGTRVPMFISHKRGLTPNADTPTYLYGYGGFNIALTPFFSVSHLVWMEMGGVYAQANLRGGSEYGTAWHEAGMRLNKQNVFDDFIASAEWLIENGYTSTPRLAIGGRSNGGLLVGACLTQRPDLFGACLAGVGVLDMLRFHRFTIGWAWVRDYGSPDDPDEFKALLAYSPYHNLTPETAHPPTLIATGDHDDSVFPAHSFKFAAALQAAQAGPAPALIRVYTRAGHGRGKPTAMLIEEATDLWAFLVRALRID